MHKWHAPELLKIMKVVGSPLQIKAAMQTFEHAVSMLVPVLIPLPASHSGSCDAVCHMSQSPVS